MTFIIVLESNALLLVISVHRMAHLNGVCAQPHVLHDRGRNTESIAISTSVCVFLWFQIIGPTDVRREKGPGERRDPIDWGDTGYLS